MAPPLPVDVTRIASNAHFDHKVSARVGLVNTPPTRYNALHQGVNLRSQAVLRRPTSAPNLQGTFPTKARKPSMPERMRRTIASEGKPLGRAHTVESLYNKPQSIPKGAEPPTRAALPAAHKADPETVYKRGRSATDKHVMRQNMARADKDMSSRAMWNAVFSR